MFTFSSDVSPCLIVSKCELPWTGAWNESNVRGRVGQHRCAGHKQELFLGAHTHSLHNVHYCWWSTRLPPVCLVFLCPSKQWECWSTKELVNLGSLIYHWCKKSFSNQDLKRVEAKAHSKASRPLSIVGEQFIEEQFIQQTHALCAFGSKWQKLFPFMLHPSPLCLTFWSTGPVKNASGLTRNSSAPQQIKKLGIFSIVCCRDGWNTWGDALLFICPLNLPVWAFILR